MGERVFFKRTKEQAKDTGIAMALLLLILSWVLHLNVLSAIAIVVLVVAVVFPGAFKPLAVLWFGFADILGMISSRFLLTIVFFAVVTPIGLLRRLFGKDELLLKLFKKSETSVMKVRDYTFTASDLETPY